MANRARLPTALQKKHLGFVINREKCWRLFSEFRMTESLLNIIFRVKVKRNIIYPQKKQPLICRAAVAPGWSRWPTSIPASRKQIHHMKNIINRIYLQERRLPTVQDGPILPCLKRETTGCLFLNPE